MRTFNLYLGCIAGFAVLMLPVATGSQTAAVDDDLEVDAELTCPQDGAAGSTISVDLRLENSECRAVSVRIMSRIPATPR